METILSLSNITKSYRHIRALNNVSFDVPKGSVFGILGPNGSGKTTLLGIILDVLRADSGNYQWLNGVPIREARKKIGSLLETPNFYHYMNAWDNLEVAAKIKNKGLNDREDVLQKVNLWERKKSKFNTYSLGMKQRLAIASTLLGDPDILVFDEPTNGLDPTGITEIRELIIDLNKEGKTIIIASHLLDEVEKVCSHVAILKKGDLLVNGHVNDALTHEDQIEISSDNLKALKEIVSQMNGVNDIKLTKDALLLSCDTSIKPIDINAYCSQKGVTLSHLLLKKKSLESKFMELINK